MVTVPVVTEIDSVHVAGAEVNVAEFVVVLLFPAVVDAMVAPPRLMTTSVVAVPPAVPIVPIVRLTLEAKARDVFVVVVKPDVVTCVPEKVVMAVFWMTPWSLRLMDSIPESARSRRLTDRPPEMRWTPIRDHTDVGLSPLVMSFPST